MRSVHRILAALLAVMTSALLFIASSGSAAAAPAGPTKATTVTATRVATDGTGVQDVIIISCTIRIDNPHNSHHVPDTVNVESKVTCSAPVFAISGIIGLFRNDAQVNSKTSQSFGSSSLSMNVAVPCANGTYVGVSLANVYFPAGFVPPSGQIGGQGNAAIITC